MNVVSIGICDREKILSKFKKYNNYMKLNVKKEWILFYEKILGQN